MKLRSSKSPNPLPDVLFRIKRGLAGYVSYLAACDMNEAFSEYMLYEPMLRILTARRFTVKCESACPGLPKAARGDLKRIDFEVSGHGLKFAIEVKWAKETRLDVKRDQEKLAAFHNHYPASRSFLCIFGRKKFIENIRLNGYAERGDPVYADFKRTRFGCRIFELSATRN